MYLFIQQFYIFPSFFVLPHICYFAIVEGGVEKETHLLYCYVFMVLSAWARFLYRQWVGLGLRDVRLSNHTVLLSLPGPAPNTITDSSSNQCFLPCGTPCDQPGGSYVFRSEPAYAAYSAVGSLEAEVVDVEYGAADRLRQASGNVNLTGRIALLKLGQAPLLYKLSLLSVWGLGGALLYVDPCDAPPDLDVLHQAFSMTLNPGGHPLSPGTPSVHPSRGAGGSLTSLLVQPISASLAKRLLSSPTSPEGGGASLREGNGERAGESQLSLQCVHFLQSIFPLFPDRHVLVGSHHDSSQGGGAPAIMTQLISTMMEQAKGGWAPDRTTVFCSWGGASLGHIGSLQWGQEHRVVLQSSAVSYVSLNSPVRGTERLRATASPALLQQLLSCMRGGNCPGPNVSSSQLPGDVSFFANQLAVPTVEFAFEQSKDEETTTYLSEVQFAIEPPETLDPLYKFHETIAKMTAEAIFRLVNDPVLPFYPLDVALDVQNKLKAVSMPPPALLSWATSLRDRAAFLQSETMRPANDPKEREPSHVRMLNDVLRDLEKSFVVPHAPPGVYRLRENEWVPVSALFTVYGGNRHVNCARLPLAAKLKLAAPSCSESITA
uniref:N-acetylated alpha-linked acidic dipeptidase like 2 n=1 Tax=Gadus morhua TaxID=8049 RepID=A0A8C5A2Q9_GADMO